MNSYSCIAEFRLRSSARNCNREVMRILKCIKFTRALFVNNLVIRDSSLPFRIPINNARTSIYQSGVMHSFKSRTNREIPLLIEGKCFAAPVERSTYLFNLIFEFSSVFFDKLFHLGYKCFPADIVPALTLFFISNLFYFGIGCDGGMISAREP